MNKKEIICIVCPRGCHLVIDENLKVTGNSCKRGETYGIEEVTHPTRMVTSTVVIENGTISRLPVKTHKPVPKEKIFEVMKSINEIVVQAPIKRGEIILSNINNLGIDIIATRTI